MNNPGGGAERVLADVASGLSLRGHDVTVLSYDRPNGCSYYPLDPSVKRIELGLGDTVGQTTPLETLYRMLALRRFVKSHDPDVTIGFMHSMFLPLGIALFGTKSKIIASEHIVPAHYKTRPLQWFLLKLSPLLVSCMTCVSDQVRMEYPTSIRKIMRTLHNPISLQAQKKADVLASSHKRKLLLTVGRLEEQKNHTLLINAFAKLAPSAPNWDLSIIGEGSLRQELESLISKHNLQDRIFLPGATRNIGQRYEAAQLFTLPSHYESFGLTTAEALAHSLPVVGLADCAGTNILVKDGLNGFLVSSQGNLVNNYAEALLSLMQDDVRRLEMSDKCVGLTVDYTLDGVLNAWEDLISEISNKQMQPKTK